MPKSLHLVDYSLRSRTGHHYNYDVSLRDVCRRAGVCFRLYVGKSIDPGIRDELGATAIYSNIEDSNVVAKNDDEYVRLTTEFNAEFLRDMQVLSGDVDADCVFFLQTVKVDRLMGLQAWLAAFPPERMPGVVIFLRWDMTQSPFFAPIHQMLAALGPRIRFCTDTAHLQAAYTKAGFAVDLVPIPHTVRHPGPPPAGLDPVLQGFLADRTAPLAGYFGPGRWEKGFHLLPRLIEHVADVAPRTRFLIQSPLSEGRTLAAADQQDEAFRRIQQMAETSETVLWLNAAVDDALYHYLMSCCDIVLLPYVGEKYMTASSGIFVEAVAAGKVTVAPRGSWMEAQAKEHGTATVLFEQGDPAYVALAQLKAQARLPELSARAEAKKAAWQTHHSPESLLAYLLA